MGDRSTGYEEDMGDRIWRGCHLWWEVGEWRGVSNDGQHLFSCCLLFASLYPANMSTLNTCNSPSPPGFSMFPRLLLRTPSAKPFFIQQTPFVLGCHSTYNYYPLERPPSCPELRVSSPFATAIATAILNWIVYVQPGNERSEVGISGPFCRVCTFMQWMAEGSVTGLLSPCSCGDRPPLLPCYLLSGKKKHKNYHIDLFAWTPGSSRPNLEFFPSRLWLHDHSSFTKSFVCLL